MVHSRAHIDSVHAFTQAGGGALDQDTYVVPASWDAALHAAGAGPSAVDALRSGTGSAFVAVRPPGHHAERSRAMGFCVFNNIAITARYLTESGERVAIVDWDVHHGNGTQNTFLEDPAVMYVSLHEFPFYPGTGWLSEIGEGKARGMTINVPLPNATTATDYLAAFRRIVMPPLRQFAPTWILISSGYDAHVDDPLGGLRLESDHYGWMANELTTVVPRNRQIAFLEGGYDLDALATGSIATVRGLSGAYADVAWPHVVDGQARRITDMVSDVVGRYWNLG
jgi:acetoin utilization deacetylase AcuC-like enzyme